MAEKLSGKEQDKNVQETFIRFEEKQRKRLEDIIPLAPVKEQLSRRYGQLKQNWKKRTPLFKLVTVVIGIVILGFLIQAIFGSTPEEKAATSLSSEKIKRESAELLGNLEVIIGDMEEQSYEMSTLVKEETEFGQTVNQQVVTIIYEMIPLRVFNPTTEDIVFRSIKLVDNLGNEYLPDSNPPDNVLPSFGHDAVVSPSTIRNGILFFLPINEDADDLELIIELESGEKKVVEFDR